MAAYVIYSNTSGRIIRTGSCPAAMLANQAGVGEKLMQVKHGVIVDQRRQKVSAGKVVSCSAAELELVDADIKGHNAERERKRKNAT